MTHRKKDGSGRAADFNKLSQLDLGRAMDELHHPNPSPRKIKVVDHIGGFQRPQ